MNLNGTVRGEKTKKSVAGLSILIYENGVHGKNLVGIGRVESSDGKFSAQINENLQIRKDAKFDIVIGVSQIEKRLELFPTFKHEAIDTKNVQNIQINIPDRLIDEWIYLCMCIPITGHLYKETILPDGTVMKCPVVSAEVCAIDLIRPVLCPFPNICDIFPELCDIDIRDICKIRPEICRLIEKRDEFQPPIVIKPPPPPDPIVIKEMDDIRENFQRIKQILQVKSGQPEEDGRKRTSKEISDIAKEDESLVGVPNYLTDTSTLLKRFEAKSMMDEPSFLSKSLTEKIIDQVYGEVIGKEVVGCDITDENGFFSICVPRYRIWRPCKDNTYDIIFRATKMINGLTVEIYHENIGSSRILPSGGINVELITKAPEVPCTLPHPPGICNAANGYAFWGVGRLSIAQIQDGLAEWFTPGSKDSPFAGTIDIKFCFSHNFVGEDERFNHYYYQVRAVAMSDAAPTPPADTPGNGWFTVADELWTVWTIDDLSDGIPTTITPITVGTEEGLYRIDNILIYNTNVAGLALRLRTNRALFGSKVFNGVTYYGNGKYAFRVRIFHESSGVITEVTSLDDRGAPGTESPLILRFDNTPPVARLRSIDGLTADGHTSVTIEGGMSGECPIYKKSQVSSLTIKFDANDDKYFKEYWLQYFTGHNIHDLLNPVDGSQIYTSLVEPQRSYGFTNKSCVWNLSTMSPCAYQIRLNVWDRRQDGYSSFSYTEDTFHLTITS